MKLLNKRKQKIPKTAMKKSTLRNLRSLYQIDRQEKLKDKAKKLDIEKNIDDLKVTNKIKVEKFLSDNRYVSENFSDKIKNKVNKMAFVYCCIHFPNGNDVVKRFPMIRKNVLDVAGTYCMFSAKSFRYINGKRILYFYYDTPFAILHDVKEKTSSLDGTSFTSVQKSKFVEDMVQGAKEKPSSAVVILIIGFALSVFIGLGNLIMVIIIMNKLGG